MGMEGSCVECPVLPLALPVSPWPLAGQLQANPVLTQTETDTHSNTERHKAGKTYSRGFTKCLSIILGSPIWTRSSILWSTFQRTEREWSWIPELKMVSDKWNKRQTDLWTMKLNHWQKDIGQPEEKSLFTWRWTFFLRGGGHCYKEEVYPGTLWSGWSQRLLCR